MRTTRNDQQQICKKDRDKLKRKNVSTSLNVFEFPRIFSPLSLLDPQNVSNLSEGNVPGFSCLLMSPGYSCRLLTFSWTDKTFSPKIMNVFEVY
jgi:hypothetical protein